MKTLTSSGACAAIFTVFGALIAPVIAFAQTDTAPTELTPVVVTATRTELPESETLAAVTVITREQIERAQATDLAEILRFEAGLDLGRTGGPGQQSAIFMRGGESNHTLVLIDGVRVNPATSGGAAVQNISPDMIERIEIVRGPRSTLYGSDAIGGVINVITRGGESGADLRLRAGADETRDISGRLGYADAVKSLSLQAQRIDTDGFPSCANSSIDRGYGQTTLNARGAVQLGGGATLSGRLWDARGNTEYMDFCGDFNSPLDQDFQNQTVAVDLDLQLTPNWNSTFTLARGEDDIRQNQPNYLGDKDFVRTVRPALDWHNVVQVGAANRVSFGAQIAREDVAALSFGGPIDESRDLYSVFAQDEIKLGRNRLVVAAGYADYDTFGDELTWNLEYGYDLFASTRLIASAGSGFRAPDASDLYGFGGDPDLKPERARNYELGLRQQLGERQTIDLRAFQSNVDELITVICDETFTCLAQNIDEYRNRGAELSWRYSDESWSAALSGILQKPEDRSTGSVLARRAKRSVTARVARKFGEHYLALDVLGSGERPDVGGRTNGGYALVNLAAGLQLDQHFRAELRFENLLDKQYQTAAGYNQQGGAGYVTLSYRY